MSWSPADDYDDHGNHHPGPYPSRPRFTRCSERCCTGTPLCHDPEEAADATDR